MNNDLRSFLEKIKKEKPGEFASVEREVDPAFELTAVVSRLEKKGQFPVVYFDKVKGSPFPVVVNLFGKYERLAEALSIHGGADLVAAYAQKEKSLRKPKTVKSAAVKEGIYRGGEVDLSSLPIPVHNELDSGRYITAGCLVARDPESGYHNLGIYRNEVKGKNKLAVMFNPIHHLGAIYRKHLQSGAPLEAAIFIGHHPAVLIASQAKKPFEADEYEIAGALLGEPIELIKGETVSVDVPAASEIVIEGIIDPKESVVDGPFGEYTGYYGERRKVALMEVTAITMRSDAIYHDIFAGHPEHAILAVLPRESHLFSALKSLLPSVKAVRLPYSGRTFHAYLSIKKSFDGEGKRAGLIALGIDPFIKHVFVVDDDINIENDGEIMWAVATRFDSRKDLSISPYTLGSHLDPTAYDIKGERPGNMTSKMVIDATRPIGGGFAQTADVPPQWSDQIKLEDYLVQ